MSTARVFEVSMVECPLYKQEVLENCCKCEYHKGIIGGFKMEVLCKCLEGK